MIGLFSPVGALLHCEKSQFLYVQILNGLLSSLTETQSNGMIGNLTWLECDEAEILSGVKNREIRTRNYFYLLWRRLSAVPA